MHTCVIISIFTHYFNNLILSAYSVIKGLKVTELKRKTIDSAHFSQLEKYQMSLLFFDRHWADINSSNFTVDIFAAVYEAVCLLPKKVLAGFGDNLYLKVTAPEVVSIVQPDKAIAEVAFEVIAKKIENHSQPIENRIFTTNILNR